MNFNILAPLYLRRTYRYLSLYHPRYVLPYPLSQISTGLSLTAQVKCWRIIKFSCTLLIPVEILVILLFMNQCLTSHHIVCFPFPGHRIVLALTIHACLMGIKEAQDLTWLWDTVWEVLLGIDEAKHFLVEDTWIFEICSSGLVLIYTSLLNHVVPVRNISVSLEWMLMTDKILSKKLHL